MSAPESCEVRVAQSALRRFSCELLIGAGASASHADIVVDHLIVEFDGRPYKGVDLLAGGLPCPPFSAAGKQLGAEDDRNLFPAALRLIDEIWPRAVMIENVRGFLDAVFEDYRLRLKEQLRKLGYETDWRLLNASEFGVPQLRPRVVIVALKKDLWEHFDWPQVSVHNPRTVGEILYDLMATNGWRGSSSDADRILTRPVPGVPNDNTQPLTQLLEPANPIPWGGLIRKIVRS